MYPKTNFQRGNKIQKYTSNERAGNDMGKGKWYELMVPWKMKWISNTTWRQWIHDLTDTTHSLLIRKTQQFHRHRFSSHLQPAKKKKERWMVGFVDWATSPVGRAKESRHPTPRPTSNLSNRRRYVPPGGPTPAVLKQRQAPSDWIYPPPNQHSPR